MAKSIPVVAPISRAELEDRASKILGALQPRGVLVPQPIEIERYYEFGLPQECGIETTHERLGSGIEGYTEVREDGSAISAISLEVYEEAEESPHARRRCRSTIGHECGHIILHVPQLRNAMFRYRSELRDSTGIMYRKAEDVPAYLDPEWQAYNLSGALLMPKQAVLVAVGQGWSIPEMAKVFDLNPAFVQWRLKSLGMTAGTRHPQKRPLSR
jgi:hypothetical protein